MLARLKNEKWKNAKCMDKAGDSQEEAQKASACFSFKSVRSRCDDSAIGVL